MRPLESYCIYLALYAVWHGSALPFTYVATCLIAVLTLAHLALEHPRWQLTLLYAQVAHLVYSILIDSHSDWPAGWLWIIASSTLIMATSALACLFPVAKFPAVSGRFQTVGVAQRFLPTARASSTPSRVPAGVQDVQRFPYLGVTVFYPSALEATSKTGAPFLSSGVLGGLAGFLKLPAALFSYVSLGRIRAVADLPIVPASGGNGHAATGAAGSSAAASRVPAKLPVLVLSHGLGGVADMYAMQATELASQGFVVFAPTHNDESACLAELPEGRTIPYKQPPAYGHPDMHSLRAAQLQTRAAEISFIIDTIESSEASGQWPVNAPFAGRLDTGRIAAVGHSFGAATVTLATHQDDRIKAVVANDLWMLPLPKSLISAGLQRAPLLITQSTAWTKWREQSDHVREFARKSRQGRLITFHGTGHSNYSDVPLFSQLLSRKMGQIGSLEFREGMRRINAAQTDFLQRELATTESPAPASSKPLFADLIANKEITVLYSPEAQ